MKVVSTSSRASCCENCHCILKGGFSIIRKIWVSHESATWLTHAIKLLLLVELSCFLRLRLKSHLNKSVLCSSSRLEALKLVKIMPSSHCSKSGPCLLPLFSPRSLSNVLAILQLDAYKASIWTAPCNRKLYSILSPYQQWNPTVSITEHSSGSFC